MEREGVNGVKWEYTGGTHQRATGTILVKGGERQRVSLTCSLSPSDRRAAYKVRTDVRRAVRDARGAKP
jgi:hypothetical protein